MSPMLLIIGFFSPKVWVLYFARGHGHGVAIEDEGLGILLHRALEAIGIASDRGG